MEPLNQNIGFYFAVWNRNALKFIKYLINASDFYFDRMNELQQIEFAGCSLSIKKFYRLKTQAISFKGSVLIQYCFDFIVTSFECAAICFQQH